MYKRIICFISIMSLLGTVFSAMRATISPSGSDIAGDGSEARPFATLNRAFSAVKSGAAGDWEIVVKGGEYFVPKCARINKNELNNKRLSIVGQKDSDGNYPIFVGGKKVPSSALREVEDKTILNKIPADKQGTLYYIDLKNLGMTDYGQMRQRGFGTGAKLTEMEAFINLTPMVCAQYPNDKSILKIGEVLDPGHIRSKSANQGAYKAAPDTHIRGATFKYIDKRHVRWTDAPEAFVRGNLSVGWADDQIKIKKIDTQKGTVELAWPHCYGVSSCVPDKNGKLSHADIAVRGYQVYNLIEELDRNGEYFIDRKNGIFYVMFSEKPMANFYFSILAEPFIEISNARNVEIKNLRFAVNRSTGIKMNGCEASSVKDCDIFLCGRGLAVFGNRMSVAGCRIFDCAYGGATVYGGDRKTLTRSDNTVRNCEFSNNARLKMNYSAALKLGGVGETVSNCDFRDHPHVTIAYGGNDNVIEKCTFVRCCKGSSDMGVTYTGRDQSEQGNIIRNNFFSDNLPPDAGAMMCGVYVDDGSAGTLISKNIFCRTGSIGRSPAFGAVYFHGGCQNRVIRNVFIECEQGAGQQTWTDEKYAAALKREAHRFYKNVDVKSEVYRKRYPEMEKLFNPSERRENLLEQNRVFRTPLSLSGNMILKHNKLLRPNKGVQMRDIDAVKSWTLDDVKKFFGSDSVVADCLKSKMGSDIKR